MDKLLGRGKIKVPLSVARCSDPAAETGEKGVHVEQVGRLGDAIATEQKQ
jgi:hypothetical protein